MSSEKGMRSLKLYRSSSSGSWAYHPVPQVVYSFLASGSGAGDFEDWASVLLRSASYARPPGRGCIYFCNWRTYLDMSSVPYLKVDGILCMRIVNSTKKAKE